MGERRVDPKHCKLYAFCKHWFDPTNSVIEPTRSPFTWVVKYTLKKNVCLARGNIMVSANMFRGKFECKI